jgi:hypothetical protein
LAADLAAVLRILLVHKVTRVLKATDQVQGQIKDRWATLLRLSQGLTTKTRVVILREILTLRETLKADLLLKIGTLSQQCNREATTLNRT